MNESPVIPDRYRRIAHELARGQSEPLRLRVISDSMRPLLRTGDTVTVQSIDPGALRRGEVIVVQRGDDLITHRLVGVDARGWHTRGDNADDADAIASAESIVGRVIAIERGGACIDLRGRRWAIANQLAGGAGWLHTRLMHLRQGRTPTAESHTKSIGARLLALPFRMFIKTIVWVLLKI